MTRILALIWPTLRTALPDGYGSHRVPANEATDAARALDVPAMLDRLEKSELIARRPNPKDRRSTHIVMVKETAEKLAPLFASLREAQDSTGAAGFGSLPRAPPG